MSWLELSDSNGQKWMVPDEAAWKVIAATESPDGSSLLMQLEDFDGKRHVITASRVDEDV